MRGIQNPQGKNGAPTIVDIHLKGKGRNQTESIREKLGRERIQGKASFKCLVQLDNDQSFKLKVHEHSTSDPKKALGFAANLVAKALEDFQREMSRSGVSEAGIVSESYYSLFCQMQAIRFRGNHEEFKKGFHAFQVAAESAMENGDTDAYEDALQVLAAFIETKLNGLQRIDETDGLDVLLAQLGPGVEIKSVDSEDDTDSSGAEPQMVQKSMQASAQSRKGAKKDADPAAKTDGGGFGNVLDNVFDSFGSEERRESAEVAAGSMKKSFKQIMGVDRDIAPDEKRGIYCKPLQSDAPELQVDHRMRGEFGRQAMDCQKMVEEEVRRETINYDLLYNMCRLLAVACRGVSSHSGSKYKRSVLSAAAKYFYEQAEFFSPKGRSGVERKGAAIAFSERCKTHVKKIVEYSNFKQEQEV